METSAFEREYYERRTCFVARNDPGYYSRLLSVEDLDVVLGTHDVTHQEINLVRGQDGVPRKEYTHPSGRIDPLGVARQFDQGATVTFNHLHRRIPALGALCVAIGKFFSSRVQTNIYLTPPDAQGFQPHWDTHDVFVLQLGGRKNWSVHDCETKVALPLKGQCFDRERDVCGPVVDRYEIQPGDLLYIPRGVMHSARSVDKASLHITLGLTSFTWTDFLLESVASVALQEESLRRSLPRGFVNGSPWADADDRLVGDRLKVVGSRLKSSDVWRHFRNEVLVANGPLFTDLLGVRMCSDTLTLSSRVRRRRHVVVEFESDAGECVLRFCGREVRFPEQARSAAKFVAGTEAFRVRGIPDCLDEESKLELVERLVKEGLLCAIQGE